MKDEKITYNNFDEAYAELVERYEELEMQGEDVGEHPCNDRSFRHVKVDGTVDVFSVSKNELIIWHYSKDQWSIINAIII